MFFKFTTAGESHGKALVAIIEGLPAGLEIDVEQINRQLWRRQQGYGRGGRMKIESDTIEILSGVRHGKTLGSPVALSIENRDFVHWQETMASEKIAVVQKNPRIVKRPRPGHADLAGGQKFGARDLRDILERASARETAARVACGAFARQLLEKFGVAIKSHVIKLGSFPENPLTKTFAEISSIEFLTEDCFIQALEFPKREFLRQHIKYDRVIVYFALQLADAGVKDFLMIEGQRRYFIDGVPVKLVVIQLEIVIPDIYERIKCGSNNPSCRVAVHISKTMHLFKENVIKTGSFL
jgi:chorismate synthase